VAGRLVPQEATRLGAADTAPVAGKLNKQIADEMNLAELTIKAHMSAIFRKLGVNNRTQAILMLEGRG